MKNRISILGGISVTCLQVFSIILVSNVIAEEKAELQENSIIVTGVRADNKTPISQKTIKRETIERTYQGEEIPVLLDKTPSITSQSDGGHPQGYTTFRLRGIDQTRINMTLNGVPLNEPEDQGVYTSNFPGFINSIRSTQIQRGVGTSSNGVASYAGSVNFESQNGLQKKREIQTGYGSWNTKRVNFTNSTGLTDDKFALFTNLSAYKTDGYKDHSGGIGYSLFNSGGYYGEKDTILIHVFSGKSLNQMAWLAVPIESIQKNRRTNANSKEEKDEFSQNFSQVQYIRTLTLNSKVTSSIFYNHLDGEWSLNEVSVGTGTDLLTYGLHSNFYGLISNYNYTGNKFNINFGVSGNFYDRKHTATRRPDLSKYEYSNVGKKNEKSTFFKVGYDLWKFTFFLDIQYRYTIFKYNGEVKLDDQKWNFTNPKTGVMLTVSPQLNYYFSVGQSHREPTRTNMFGGNDNLKDFVKIKPEEVVDYELGMNIRKDKLSMQTNLYYMKFRNEINLLGALGSNGLPLMGNVSRSYRSGLEVDLSYAINKLIKIVNSTNYSHNRIIDDGKTFQPLYTPILVVNQGIEISYENFNLGLNAKHHSKSYINFDNTLTTPAFITYGFNFGYTFGQFIFLLQGVNLTSVNYFTSGYAIASTPYYFANAPMSVYATLKMEF